MDLRKDIKNKGGDVMKEYDVFIRLPERIEDGRELGMVLRDTGTYEHIPARVKVFKSFEKHADKDKLLVRTPLGLFCREPWAIEILERLGEEFLLDSKFHLCTEFEGGL